MIGKLLASLGRSARRSHPRRRRRQAGFTLIELMVSLVLFSFAIAGILSIAVTMVAGFREQRISISTEMSARMSMEFVGDAIRGAAPGVATATRIQHTSVPASGTCVAGGFIVVNSTSTADSLVVVYPSGAVLTSLRTPYVASTTAVTVADASQLAVGDTLLFSNETEGHLVKVTGVNTATGALTLAAQTCTGLTLPSNGYPAGSLVIRVERVQFYVANLTLDDNVTQIPTLMMDPDAEGSALAEPLAEGVEDFQVALAVDVNGDGAIAETANGATDEWYGNNASDPALPANSIVRGVRVWMVARAASPIAKGSYLRPGVGDRAGAGTADAFRRRVLSSIIEIRNNELSP